MKWYTDYSNKLIYINFSNPSLFYRNSYYNSIILIIIYEMYIDFLKFKKSTMQAVGLFGVKQDFTKHD